MQREWADCCLGETLSRDIARTVWHDVQRLDLTQLYAAIQVSDDQAVALWHALAFNLHRMMHLQAWLIPC